MKWMIGQASSKEVIRADPKIRFEVLFILKVPKGAVSSCSLASLYFEKITQNFDR